MLVEGIGAYLWARLFAFLGRRRPIAADAAVGKVGRVGRRERDDGAVGVEAEETVRGDEYDGGEGLRSREGRGRLRELVAHDVERVCAQPWAERRQLPPGLVRVQLVLQR